MHESPVKLVSKEQIWRHVHRQNSWTISAAHAHNASSTSFDAPINIFISSRINKKKKRT